MYVFLFVDQRKECQQLQPHDTENACGLIRKNASPAGILIKFLKNLS